MKTRFLFFAMLLCSTMFYSSCSKEEIKGCTDPDSDNYNPDAEVSDNSCEYSSRIVFWFNTATAQFLVSDGASSLTYYVEGQLVGSSAAGVGWTGAPDCGQNRTVTADVNLGFIKTKSISYSVKDNTGFEYWKGNFDINANTCLQLQLD